MTNFSDGFFKRIEKKTNVNKETILESNKMIMIKSKILPIKPKLDANVVKIKSVLASG